MKTFLNKIKEFFNCTKTVPIAGDKKAIPRSKVNRRIVKRIYKKRNKDRS